MPLWRCPHCGTPQAEASRCWVCKRSSTSCGTCRNFRRSVAAQIGYCGLDRRRLPLRGDEMRGCWEAAAAHAEAEPPERHPPLTPARRPLGFVAVSTGGDEDDGVGPVPIPIAPATPFVAPPATDLGLWSDAEA